MWHKHHPCLHPHDRRTLEENWLGHLIRFLRFASLQSLAGCSAWEDGVSGFYQAFESTPMYRCCLVPPYSKTSPAMCGEGP